MMESVLRYDFCPCPRKDADCVIQIHKLKDGTISVFSRNSEDMTKKYPELVDQLAKVRKIA